MKFLRYKKTTEEKIKEATFYLLAEKGYKDLTMRDVAKRADAAVGQLTYYYRTKENLILSVIEELFNACTEQLRKTVNNSEDKLMAIFNFYEEIFKVEQEGAMILVNFMTESLWDMKLKTVFNDFVNETKLIVEDAYKSRGESEENARIKSGFFISSVHGMISQNLLLPIENTNVLGEYKKFLLSI